MPDADDLGGFANVYRMIDICRVTNAAAGVAASGPDVIRPPPAARAYVVVFRCIWCGVVLAGLIAAAAHGWPAAVIPLLILAFGLTLGYRMFRLSVTLGPQELLVRNYYRTRRIARTDVEGFRQGALSQQTFNRTNLQGQFRIHEASPPGPYAWHGSG